MTSNQINYAKHKEEVRHNKEMESQGRSVIQETGRHNLASEDIGYSNVGLGYSNLAESSRHNRAQESINWFTAQNLAYLQGQQSEYYSSLSNKVSSEVGVERSKLVSGSLNSLFGNLQAQRQLGENIRHNTAVEKEASRANKATEKLRSRQLSETKRHNKVTEDQGRYDNITKRRSANARNTEALFKAVSPVFGLWAKGGTK